MRAGPTLTIAICSYQRRDSLLRLLSALSAQAQADPEEWRDIDVLVVIDGSTDGSTEMAESLSTSYPLEVVALPHSGLSVGRNECLKRAKGELIYFLDDDLVPADGTVARHHRAQRDDGQQIVLGPCVIPPDFPVPISTRRWWEARYRELADMEIIDRFDRFSIANASGPTEHFLRAGGFSTDFVGYGLEDYELGLRLMQANIYERFEPSAVAWHYSLATDELTLTRQRDMGRNAVRLLAMHPQVAGTLLPLGYPNAGAWLLDRTHIKSPRLLFRLGTAVGKLAHLASKGPVRLQQHLSWLASDASHSAGVADLDATLVHRFLGRPAKPTTGWLWKRRTVGTERDVAHRSV